MPSLGSVDFEILNASGSVIGDQGQDLESIERAGADGRAYRTLGTRPKAAQYQGIKGHSSASSLTSTKASLRGLVGTRTTLVDDLGQTHNVVVLSVDFTREKVAGLVVGFGGAYLLSVTLTVEVNG